VEKLTYRISGRKLGRAELKARPVGAGNRQRTHARSCSPREKPRGGRGSKCDPNFGICTSRGRGWGPARAAPPRRDHSTCSEEHRGPRRGLRTPPYPLAQGITGVPLKITQAYNIKGSGGFLRFYNLRGWANDRRH